MTAAAKPARGTRIEQVADARLARRLRIASVLMAVWFVIISCVVALLARDILGGLLTMALVSLGFALGVLWTDDVRLLPGGRLSSKEKRVLQAGIPGAFGLGLCAMVLAKSNADLAAVVVAAAAGALAVAAGALSVWFSVR